MLSVLFFGKLMQILLVMTNYKRLSDEVFVISAIYNQDRGKYYQPSRRPRLITFTETLIIQDITKTESSNCFIIRCFEINDDKYTDLTYSRKSCIARATRISQLNYASTIYQSLLTLYLFFFGGGGGA